MRTQRKKSLCFSQFAWRMNRTGNQEQLSMSLLVPSKICPMTQGILMKLSTWPSHHTLWPPTRQLTVWQILNRAIKSAFLGCRTWSGKAKLTRGTAQQRNKIGKINFELCKGWVRNRSQKEPVPLVPDDKLRENQWCLESKSKETFL